MQEAVREATTPERDSGTVGAVDGGSFEALIIGPITV